MVNVTPAWIKELRDRLEMSQAEFAKKCAVSQSTVCEWEKGLKHPRGPARVVLEMIHNEAERMVPEKIPA